MQNLINCKVQKPTNSCLSAFYKFHLNKKLFYFIRNLSTSQHTRTKIWIQDFFFGT